jgi:hypothetical protein
LPLITFKVDGQEPPSIQAPLSILEEKIKIGPYPNYEKIRIAPTHNFFYGPTYKCFRPYPNKAPPTKFFWLSTALTKKKKKSFSHTH